MKRGRRSPVFSVIIPALNAAATVAAAVRSALSQSASDLEVIVVDDGSSDTTVDVVSAIEDRRVHLRSQPNRGLSAARNAGITAARGKYITFLDSDDLLLPRYLERAQDGLERATNPGLTYSDAYVFDPVSGKVRRSTAMQRMRPPEPPPEDAAGFLFELLQRNFVFVATTVPHSVLDTVGGFDERLSAAEDYELWLRIVVAGYGPVWLPGLVALYRSHAGQLSSDVARMNRNLLDVFMRLRIEDMPTDEHCRLLESRRRESAREVAIIAGEAPLRAFLRRMRHVGGRLRQHVGLGDSWYQTPPDEVARAFPDLTVV